MNSFLLYIAQVAVSLILLYLLYWLFFRRDTFYKLNRFFLVTSIMISLVVPAMDLKLQPAQETGSMVVWLDSITITAEQGSQVINRNIGIFQGILIAYLTGVFIFSLRFLFELFQVFSMIRKGRKTRRKGITIVHLEKKYAPFSFFGYVFINQESNKPGDLRKILDHELIHIKQGHSLDLILIELLSIFQWFNPAVWLYRKSIKENHEFLADEELINHGYDISQYQKALLNHALGIHLNDMTNNFNYSILKRRIIMMTKQKTQSSALLKYLAVLPVLGLLILGFACSNEQEDKQIEQDSTVEAVEQKVDVIHEGLPETKPMNEEEDAEIFTVVEEMPEFPGGRNALFKYLQENIRYPEAARKDSIQGRVFVSFVINKDGSVSGVKLLRGIREDLDKEAIRVVENMPDWMPGKQEGKNVRVVFNLPIRYALN
ncbi:MAG: M56 family metallopeptidase [Bacteroidales bacterium]|nr:M56 family metallopeptidase [Bacteroidales bacterium]MCF8388964.1 M56 family metallopeptidase [Bacteroidales bacterium]MCF8397119.1 M56 family metallopeptidase [Bacteroidales bacterium]